MTKKVIIKGQIIVVTCSNCNHVAQGIDFDMVCCNRLSDFFDHRVFDSTAQKCDCFKTDID